MLIQKVQDIDLLEWKKMEGLLPAVVQDAFDGRVLMQAYMNREALAHSLESGKVTFWSRSRQALWTKGETSGNTLELVEVHGDCDGDCLLVLAGQHKIKDAATCKNTIKPLAKMKIAGIGLHPCYR